jgi:hypothetical protein
MWECGGGESNASGSPPSSTRSDYVIRERSSHNTNARVYVFLEGTRTRSGGANYRSFEKKNRCWHITFLARLIAVWGRP